MNYMASRLVSHAAVAAGRPDNQGLPNAMLWFLGNAHNNTRDSWLPIRVVPFADAAVDIHHERRRFAFHQREYPDGKTVRKIDNVFVWILNRKSHPDDHEDNQRYACLTQTHAHTRNILIKKIARPETPSRRFLPLPPLLPSTNSATLFPLFSKNNAWDKDQLGRCQARTLVVISARPTTWKSFN
jgi:hypothetical protein